MQHQVFINLLSKQFSGEISPAESEMLNGWLNESAEHQRLADAYRQVWDQVELPPPASLPELDLDLAFSKVMAQIEAPQTTSSSLKVSFKIWRNLAAAIVFLIVATVGYRYGIGSEPEMIKVMALGVDKQEVHLPDGSKVWLRNGSEIAYPKTFDKNLRCVSLKGEAFFDVVPNPSVHFCVSTSANEKIEVLGTSFNVQETPAQTVVVVKTGKVKFNINEQANDCILTAGEQGLHKSGTPSVLTSKVSNFNTIAWKTGHLEFIDTPVKQVIADMEAHFNTKIQLNNPLLLNCKYTSTQVPNNLKEAIKTFCDTYKIDFSSNASGFILNGGTCL